MNDISQAAFNEELARLVSKDLQKTAGSNYTLKIPKKLIGRLGYTGVGVGLGALGMDAYQDNRVGASIRRQQGF